MNLFRAWTRADWVGGSKPAHGEWGEWFNPFKNCSSSVVRARLFDFGTEPYIDRHPNEGCEVYHLHLGHDPCAVHFDGALADLEIERHGLVRPTLHEPVENFALPAGQGVEPAEHVVGSGNAAIPPLRHGQRALHATDQGSV